MSTSSSQNAYTIGRTAALIGVSPVLLRTWEKKLQWKPTHRQAGQQRRYTKADIEWLKYVHHLRHEKGYSYAKIKDRLALGKVCDTLRQKHKAMLATLTHAISYYRELLNKLIQ